MPYVTKTYRFANAIERVDYHDNGSRAPGEARRKKRKPTPEQVEKINQANRERTCRHKLRANFEPADYFTTLTYAKELRPADMDAAKKDWQIFVRRVRKEYKKRGQELKWIRNIEVGTRGAWHIHMVINRIQETDVIIAAAWAHGRILNQLLYERGEFAKLAEYITKTPKTDKRLAEAHYSTSRNLPTPDPEKVYHNMWKTWGKVRVPKGWYLDKDSYVEDINPVTGFKYRRYTLLRLERKKGKGRKIRYEQKQKAAAGS